MRLLGVLILILILAVPSSVVAQQSLTQLDTAAVEDFAGFGGAGFEVGGGAAALDSNAWRVSGLSDGDLAFGDTATMGDYARGTSTGGVVEGGIYGFDVGGGNIALGAQGTDTDLAPGVLVWRVLSAVDTVPITEVELTWTVYAFNDQAGESTVSVEIFDGAQSVPVGQIVSTGDAPDAMPGWIATTQTARAVLGAPYGGTIEVRITVDGAGAALQDEVAIDDLALSATSSGTVCTDNMDCDDMDPCTDDLCGGAGCVHARGCVIDGTCVAAGATEENSTCLLCAPSLAANGWTSRGEGAVCAAASCDSGDVVGDSQCDAQDMCVAPEPTVCPNGCENAACLAPCVTDADCNGWCDLDVGGGCTTRNRVPVAVAGPDQTVRELDVVTLDGRASYDDDGDTIFHSWTQVSGPIVVLDDPTSSTPTFQAPRVQATTTPLEFWLQVHDGDDNSLYDATVITVANSAGNAPPTAVISGPTMGEAGTTVTLDGSESSDPDSDPLRFVWAQIEGPSATLGRTNGGIFDVTLPEAPGQSIVLSLIVNDGLANSAVVAHTIDIVGDSVMDPVPPVDVAEGPVDVAELGADALPGTVGGQGCGCAVVRSPGLPWGLVALPLVGAVLWWRRRRSEV